MFLKNHCLYQIPLSSHVDEVAEKLRKTIANILGKCILWRILMLTEGTAICSIVFRLSFESEHTHQCTGRLE
jgi:hypothetical protein